jgi:16S rRNA (guanine527-N7)-methyltransferase
LSSSLLLTTDERLERWLAALLATPGLTALRDRERAWRELLENSLRAVPLVERFEGAIVDVGSGGGAQGIPLAAALPTREVTLLEANGRKVDFLERWTRDFPNLHVVRGRAEEQETERFGVALAKALAPPPVAAEWCLPLVRVGGAAILFVGPSADLEQIGRAAEQLGSGEPESQAGLVILHKRAPTPAGFPRRPGVARKRPLA